MPVGRDEILDYVTYGEQRDQLRPLAMAAKRDRRIQVGDALTFLFENRDTVRYQVHEMLRTERIVKEAEIRHELDTYNELLGGPGQLGCSLLIGLDEAVRDATLRQWMGLNEHLYALLPDGTKVRATWDQRQVGDDRLSSVQYLKFAVGPEAPVAMGSDFPALTVETRLSAAQRAALASDLAEAAEVREARAVGGASAAPPSPRDDDP